ncbi:MAG: nicotinate (nicotinamide) nucleotide adenylyltransferase [Solirubrobacterales bacterium]|nr:nicotinate (nicotinamide) nucleotide adenylyltransferase [Solirubrobacterales bacterium]
MGALGVLGGAFNPPHIGHLVLASEAASRLGLDRVLLVPVGEAPHKRIEGDPGAEARLEMTRLAAVDDELIEASDLEVAREGPSYSFRTLELLSAQRPEDQLFFLMGADVAAYLESWREPERVLELARLGVAARPGTVLDEAEAALERLGAADRAEVIPMPEIGVSSTRVRRRVAEGRPIRYLVPDAVAGFIAERDLYRQAVRA